MYDFMLNNSLVEIKLYLDIAKRNLSVLKLRIVKD